MTIDQISVFVENDEGRLADIMELLAAKGVDVRALSMADTRDFGILRFIADDPIKALQTLKAEGCTVSVTPVIAVSISDNPGALSKVLRVLATEGLNVEYLYAFITRKEDNAYVILRVEDFEKAGEVLAENGIATASPQELYEI